jgi:hypothetical protein
VKRLLDWLARWARKVGLNAPYWGGIIMTNLRRVREAAANFLRRR